MFMFKYPFDTNYKKNQFMSFLNIQRLISENFSRSCRLDYGSATAISGGLAAAGIGAQTIATSEINKKNRDWQEKMYARQLADERENWNMVNAYNEEMYNKYNSPVAQARQMLQAGLNPDLQDISSGGFQPSGDVSASGVPSVSGQNPIDLIGAFMNVAEMVNGLQSMQLDNELKQAEIDKVSKSYAMDYLVKNYNPDFDENSGLVGMSDIMNDTIRSSTSVGGLATYFRKQGLSKRAANLAARFVHTTNVEDVRSEYYSRKHSSESNRKSFLTDLADPFFKDNDNDMVSALNDFLKLKPELDRALYGSQTHKARYESDYYGSKSGVADARHESRMAGFAEDIQESNANAAKNSSEVDKQLDDLISGIKNPTTQLIVRILYKYLQKFVDNRIK